MALSITLTIMLQSNYQIRCQYLDYARNLIQHFIYNSKYVYGNFRQFLAIFRCIIYINCYIYQMTVFIIVAHPTQFPASPLNCFCSDLKNQYVRLGVQLCKLPNVKKSSKMYLDPYQRKKYSQEWHPGEKINVSSWPIMLLHL